MKIVIIGGGMAGLSAALSLSESGHSVTLLERSARLGGLADCLPLAGTHLERFYHHIFATDVDILDLIEKMGLQDRMKWHVDNKGNWLGGKVYPFTTPLDILRFQPIPLLGRLRLALFSVYLTLVRDYKAYDGITAADWIRRTQGREVYRVLWEPLLKSKFGRFAEDISMSWFYGRVRARFGKAKKGAPQGKLGYLEGSMQVLVDALEKELRARGVDIRTGVEARRVVARDGAVTGVETTDGIQACEAVLATCPTSVYLKLAAHLLPASQVEQLSKEKMFGALVVILEMNESLSPVYWLSILDPACPLLAAIEHTNMVPRSNYQNEAILYLAKYLDPTEALFSLDDEGVLKYYLEHLKQVYPHFKESMVIRSHVMRDAFAQPVVTRGYAKRIPSHRAPIKGLYLANMAQIFPDDRGMSLSVGLGQKVAAMMMQDAS